MEVGKTEPQAKASQGQKDQRVRRCHQGRPCSEAGPADVSREWAGGEVHGRAAPLQ